MMLLEGTLAPATCPLHHSISAILEVLLHPRDRRRIRQPAQRDTEPIPLRHTLCSKLGQAIEMVRSIRSSRLTADHKLGPVKQRPV